MLDRRSFTKAVGLAAGTTALIAAGGGPAAGQAPRRRPRTPESTSFEDVLQIEAGELSVGYVDLGPRDGQPVVLLHGWPYDIHSFADVASILAAQGYRAIVPHLRGHGSTTFLSTRTFRNAQQSRVALDILDLMDALGIEQAVLAGYDWGSRTADIIAALWPERVKALVSVTGYLITNRETQKKPLPPAAEWAWWYQYYFATERGAQGLANETYRVDLGRLVWRFNSPTWAFDEATFQRSAQAFGNPDYADIVLHNYRWRLGLADGDRRYDALERRLAAGPSISVPTITLDGEKDPFTPAGDGAGYRDHFTGPYDHRTLVGIGHNVPQEAPMEFARAVMDADSL
ncbi:Pimeloyl-ACP methyl ester carboxylesterase [Nocardioides sp. YR527]|uniref:alpha/beta fold hydrolase n=1 Tax=Nocardioides sp. YR527 TaxID=1881028 RepID=UPI000881A796|nr:alpha/beta hydrolase [Nocardioides sp. YR527]SDK08648.1 Pimeloyl-ACP methyl ester carboxylesterase [Nocardioides sp. YR527]